MANIHLTRPKFGQQTTITNAAEDSIVLDFPTTDATLGREGDALTFTFEDGAKIRLDGFYTDYTSENTPDFIVDGQMVSGKDFFSALGQDDLMPAAGPTAATRICCMFSCLCIREAALGGLAPPKPITPQEG